jgi:hypothetical protein
MKLVKKFCWKVLTEDGLLKDHRPVGPYYDKTTFTDEFDTEEEAVSQLMCWKKKNEYGMERGMVLITTYQNAMEDWS